MSEVLLLSDNTSAGMIGMSRYIGPYVLASKLESQNISVQVLDYVSRCENLLHVIEDLLSEDTLVVGISTTFMTPLGLVTSRVGRTSERIDGAYSYVTDPILYSEPAALDQWFSSLREVINRKCPSAKIVLGGAKLQFMFDNYDLYSEVDFIIFGAADYAITELIQYLRLGNDPPHILHQTRKILKFESGKEAGAQCPKTNWSKRWGIWEKEALPIEVSRGCVFNCKFCHYDKKESFRKAVDEFKAELIYNYEMFGTQFYHFCDDCFNDHPDKVRAICNAIIDLPFKIEWISYARVDVGVRFPDTVDLMIRSGARGLFWGLESFNFEVARRAGKGTPTEKVKKFLKDFYHNYGDQCTSSGSFIVGLPGETFESQRETISWVINENALHFIDVMPLKLRPYYPNFDKVMTDFADYSRDPMKFGFQKVTFNPSFWEHQTMNSNEAYELTKEFNAAWRGSDPRRRGLIYSIWTYPHLRGLGFSQREVREIQTDEDKKNHYLEVILQSFGSKLRDYHKSLVRESMGLGRP